MANRALSAKEIIKYIRNAKVSFSYSDSSVAGASEFYRQMGASNTIVHNPKCKIDFNMTGSGTEPSIDLEFANNTKMQINPSNKDINAIFEALAPKVNEIEAELAEKGKTIDSMLA